jgi:NAD(P)-dependent dehydrogenase (short-subunit alcohol dehydrogenase family)
MKGGWILAQQMQGQVAFITGGGRGIGRGIAEAFAAEGAAVAVMARSEDQLSETLRQIEAVGGRGLMLKGDVTSQDDIDSAVAATETKLGPITTVISNAGITGPYAPIAEADPEEWWRTQEVHLRGAFLTSRAAFRSMRSRGGGRIIIISSRAAERGTPNISGYAVAKASQVRFAEMLAAEGAPVGIKAFVLHPGTVDTQFTDEALNRADANQYASGFVARLKELRKDPSAFTPMSKVTDLCVFLASGAGDELSGRYLSVDYDVEGLVQGSEHIKERDLYTLRIRTLTD